MQSSSRDQKTGVTPAVLRRRFVESAGHLTQSLGVGRSLGQIYAYIFFCVRPQSLDDLTAGLSISKGNASMSVRQLEQWGALQRVWIEGDRKVYYEASAEFGRMIRKALLDLGGRKIEIADDLLEDTERVLALARSSGKKDDEWAFIEKRVVKVRDFRNKIRGLWESPWMALLLK